MADDGITFMFYTRTLSEDYRVFADDGTEMFDYAEEFEPITERAEVESDGERSAVIFEDGGNVYVAAFGLMRGAKDRAGRDIRFSFCVILPSTKRGAAMRIFSRVADDRFDQRRFLQWLSSKPANITPPKAGYMLKYFADTDTTSDIPTGRHRRKEDEDMPGLYRKEYIQPERRRLRESGSRCRACC